MKHVLMILIMIAVLAVGAFAADQPATTAPVAPLVLLSPDPCVLMALRGLHPRLVPALTTALDLSADQTSKVTALLTKAEEDSQPAVKAQKKADENFVALLTKADASQSGLINAAIAAEAAEQRLLIQKVEALSALRELLTAPQNDLLSKWLERTSAPWQSRPAMPGK